VADEDEKEEARAAAQGDPAALADLIRRLVRDEAGLSATGVPDLDARLRSIEARLDQLASLVDLLSKTRELTRDPAPWGPLPLQPRYPAWPYGDRTDIVRPTWIGTGPHSIPPNYVGDPPASDGTRVWLGTDGPRTFDVLATDRPDESFVKRTGVTFQGLASG